MQELSQIKRKVKMREYRKRKKCKLADSSDEEENVEELAGLEEVYVKPENESVDLNEGTMDTTNDMEFGEILPDVELHDEITDSFFDFSPISNDEELETITHNIKTDPHYLQKLRLKVVQESENGMCSLEQLFTVEYIQNFNIKGQYHKKKLGDFVPYKEVYFCEFTKKRFHVFLTLIVRYSNLRCETTPRTVKRGN